MASGASPALEKCLRASPFTLAYQVLKAAGFGGLFLSGPTGAATDERHSRRDSTIRTTPTIAVASPIQTQRD